LFQQKILLVKLKDSLNAHVVVGGELRWPVTPKTAGSIPVMSAILILERNEYKMPLYRLIKRCGDFIDDGGYAEIIIASDNKPKLMSTSDWFDLMKLDKEAGVLIDIDLRRTE